MKCEECRFFRFFGDAHKELPGKGWCSVEIPPNMKLPPWATNHDDRLTHKTDGCSFGQPKEPTK